jgi:hypothetical protein
VIANKSKKRIERKLTLEWYASLVGFFPLSAMALGFSPLERGEKM